MRPGRAVPVSRQGFFLLEALLTLILLSTTVVLFTTALHLGQRILTVSRQNDQFAAFTAGMDAIAGLLGRTIPVTERSDTQSPIVIFEGGPARFAFIALSQGETHVGGLVATAIRFTPKGNKGVIEVRTSVLHVGERPSLGAITDGGKGGRETLVQNVNAAEFRFFGAKTGQPALWHSTWSRDGQLPKLVSLRARVWLRGRNETFEYTFAVNG